MKFLITGGAGFIGSNFLHYVVNKYPEDYFICLDALTYAGNYNNIKDLETAPNYRFIKGDLRNADFIDGLYDAERFDYVINFAAESHVDNSIKNPNIFAETNILGTINLMNAAKKYGIIRFHQVSTDEVYGDLPLDRPDLLFTETTPIKASSPYSASKASADLEVLAYARTFKLPVTISRCSNNYGPCQFPEKLIPLTIKRALHNEKIPVYGTGENVRDWIHVYDHNVGIDMIVRHGKNGEVYNLGGHSERTNLDIVKTILKELGKPDSLIEFVADRPGHDLRYATDSSKAEQELGWYPSHTFESGIKETITWYLNHSSWIEDIETGTYLKSYQPKKVVIIGANDFQNKLIIKARSYGYETHVFAWQDGSIGERTADHFYPISIIDKDAILVKCRDIQPSAICSIASDLASITVNYVAEALGLPCNPTSISEQCTNKYKMRETFLAHNVKTPKFIKIGIDETIPPIIDEFTLPLIVKPTDRSGSRGITKINQTEDLLPAIQTAAAESFEHCAIIEEYINGDEYSCECITQNGKHHFLAFTKKYTTGSPHFIETGHAEPSDIPVQLQEHIKTEIFKALTALGIQNSASHTEFKINSKGEFNIIEIGARMGGDCIGSDLVKISTGHDFVKMVLDVALGNPINMVQVSAPSHALIKFILSKTDLEKIEQVNREHPNELYFLSPITTFGHEVKDSSTRMGFAIYKIDDISVTKTIQEDLFNE